MSVSRAIKIGIIGGAEATENVCALAHETGEFIAKNSAVLVCGGLGGVMEAAAKGATQNGGTVIGILPTLDPATANPYVTYAIPTGLGMGRNMIVVSSSDVLIAFPGSYGTLSEIACALNLGKTVVYLPGTWELGKAGMVDAALFKEAATPRQAVGVALSVVGAR